jgi:hypothetical protein
VKVNGFQRKIGQKTNVYENFISIDRFSPISTLTMFLVGIKESIHPYMSCETVKRIFLSMRAMLKITFTAPK